MTSDYTGWTITINQRENSFGDLSGHDVDASIDKFCDVLGGKLAIDFPGADIDITHRENDLDEAIHAYRPGVRYLSAEDLTEEEDVTEAVARVMQSVFCGERGEDWAVELSDTE